MPASEIHYWQKYFSVYPFTQEREDIRTAMVAQSITNGFNSLMAQNAGKRNKPMKLVDFIPDYLGVREHSPELSLEEQQKNMDEFKNKLTAMKAKAGIKD